MTKKVNVILVTAALILVNASALFAQLEFAVGIKGGVNFAKVNMEDVTASSKTGFHGGAFALFKFTKIGIQPELLFSQQGSKLKLGPDDIESALTYVNIPVMLKLYTIAGINIQAGPQFGFLTKAEYDGEDAKDELKKSDLSAAFGLGWDLPFGLTVDGRYVLGLSKINDGADVPDTKNQVIQISIGYKIFKFGK